MANTDNKCADLKIESHDDFSNDTLALLFEKQIELQDELGFNFKQPWSIKEIADFWMVNKHAMDDEINEMFDALGGVDDGIGNAGWKYWKKDNVKATQMRIKDLSERDRLELFYEWIDAFHFFINFAISIGMTSKDVVNLYLAKHEENKRRQKNQY